MHPDAERIIALELAADRSRPDAEKAAKLGRAFTNYAGPSQMLRRLPRDGGPKSRCTPSMST
jgi:hypothetical protein